MYQYIMLVPTSFVYITFSNIFPICFPRLDSNGAVPLTITVIDWLEFTKLAATSIPDNMKGTCILVKGGCYTSVQSLSLLCIIYLCNSCRQSLHVYFLKDKTNVSAVSYGSYIILVRMAKTLPVIVWNNVLFQ